MTKLTALGGPVPGFSGVVLYTEVLGVGLKPVKAVIIAALRGRKRIADCLAFVGPIYGQALFVL